MLRWLLAVLVVLNLGFCTWSQGRLDGVLGVSAQGDREPERLARQLRAESIRILTPQSGGPASAATSAGAAAASTAAGALSAAAGTTAAGAMRAAASTPGSANVPARTVDVQAGIGGAGSTGGAGVGSTSTASAANRPGLGPAGAPAASAAREAAPVAISGSAVAAGGGAAPLTCLEAGPFAQAEWTAALPSLTAGLPAGRWSERRSETPGLWIIYMGRYADPEMLQKKKDEVAGIRVAFEELRGIPALEPGLVLGRFDNRTAADAALARSVTQGIRTARVVLVRPPVVSHYIRVPAADAALAARLSARARGPGGRSFQGC